MSMDAREPRLPGEWNAAGGPAEQQRDGLARELHDDIGQRIAFLAMNVARLTDMLSNTAVAARALADETYRQLIALGKDVQAISHRLHSSTPESMNLASAIDRFCAQLSTHHRVAIDYSHQGATEDIPDDIALNLFRVLQEALSNAMKHSGARRLTVSLQANVSHVHLEIVDNGRGFDVDAARRSKGLGLVSMRERLGLLGGELAVESEIGAGTRIWAHAPLPPKHRMAARGGDQRPDQRGLSHKV